MKAPILALMALAVFAFASYAQSGPTQHGFVVRPVPAYNRIVIGIGDTQIAVEPETVRVFLDVAPLHRWVEGDTVSAMSFQEFMADSSQIVPFLPSRYGSLGGVHAPVTVGFSRRSAAIAVVHLSNGANRRELEIPVAEARVVGEMLEQALRDLAYGEAGSPSGSDVRAQTR